MAIKIYGVLLSTAVQRVALVCNEKNVPYEIIPVDMKNGAHKEPSFLKNHPFGQIPYIDDDGFILYESRAIAHYITKQYASQGTQGLIPTDVKEEAIYEQAIATELSHFDSQVTGLAMERVYKKYRNLESDEAKVAEVLATFNTKLDAYEVILGKQRYVAGDNLTLADLNHVPNGHMLKRMGFDILDSETRPNVARWWKDITSRPSWVAIVADL
ncbi:hypothetical protein SERLA73DRAFT_136685 [Serpula lacrymans var. lacrymans S7.3]|uniref:glutathione transferase n=2 Tax=Serpula lacrymans var. lacrymans TaxID=341189 RepID=F8PXY7_SERL3|nr:uncharacterized protein SERLADRAFT_389414 [Serpula lacrymans var. lacrymans S7.9]EGN98750.1 hypothetical protein SERLA73DRAFT_136685 [Serpula lacrymans var. lacrymans S7.3]EGO24347.1 hypothetical protein SERLADRAFT_389414 [Serpula lacrymans var. lacrymans S7.9]